MTFKIIIAIHFEAFKLWTKGIKFIKKKLKLRIILQLKINVLYKFADKIVFNILKKINYGYLEITHYDGKFSNLVIQR